MTDPLYELVRFLVADPAMDELISLWAVLPYPILILGEMGTGKSILARLLHQRSKRGGVKPVVCSLAELPEGLAESHLFGHERGAFTGALSRRRGAFEMAHRGTLFLDEIGKALLPVQGKLLRAVEEQRVTRLGSESEMPLDVRLIAASNRDLEAMVREGKFLGDLLARFGYYRVTLPPLREQPWRILALATAFLAAEALVVGRDRAPILSREVEHLLVKAPWHGNTRDLHNLCRYLAGNAGDIATVRDLPGLFLKSVGLDANDPQESPVSRARRILKETGGIKSEAARRMRISRTQLYRILEQPPEAQH